MKKEYILLEANKDLKSYIGYLRREYNSYHFKNPSSSSDSRIITTLDSKAKRNIKENIKVNELLRKVGKEEYALPNVITKKSRNFSLKLIKGSTIIVKDGFIYLKTKGVNYKFIPKNLNLKEFYYTNCTLGVKNGVYYICVDKTKRLNFNNYLGNPYYEKRKYNFIIKELTKFKTGLFLKRDIGFLEQTFRKNLLQYLFDLDKKFSNIKLKTKIFDYYSEYINNLNEENLKKLCNELYIQYNHESLTSNQQQILCKILKIKGRK